MKEFIKNFGVIEESDLLKKASEYTGCFYELYTDKLICSSKIDDTKNLLELRIFNEDTEIKFRREFADEPFTYRIIDDNYFKEELQNIHDEFISVFENRVFDESHYLDIDSKKSHGTDYVTTGGGNYTLPIENAEKIYIRNYLDYDDNGIAYISDSRIVKILMKGEDQIEY